MPTTTAPDTSTSAARAVAAFLRGGAESVTLYKGARAYRLRRMATASATLAAAGLAPTDRVR